jgi:hypothetical protein
MFNDAMFYFLIRTQHKNLLKEFFYLKFLFEKNRSKRR